MDSAETMTMPAGKPLYLSVALISVSVLMLEIGLTRIFSVMFESHYVFLVISLAVLGLGLGGVYVHKQVAKSSNSNQSRVQNLICFSSALMAVSILGMTFLISKVRLFHHILPGAALAFVPFFFAGIFLSGAFRLFPEKSAKLYAADLVGASIGSLLIVYILQIGAVNASILVAILSVIPAGLFIFQNLPSKLKKGGILFLIGGLILTFLLNYVHPLLEPIPMARGSFKEMAQMLAHPSFETDIIESRWSAFGRTDLVADEKNPDRMMFFVDGTAGTRMLRFDGNRSSLNKHELTMFPGYFPFKMLAQKAKEKVLIIGAGGGRDVLISLLGGATKITAVEVNDDLVELVKKYSKFNGGIYSDFPGIKVVVQEGRNFVRATKEKYDIIMLTLPITKTSRSPEGFALTENFLFTTESINDYLDRLTSNGRLIVVAHHDVEVFRLVFTSLAAFKKKGIEPAEAMKHIYTVGPETFPLFVLKKSPLTLQEAQEIHQGMHENNYSTHSSFIPYIEQETHFTPLEDGLYMEHDMLNQALYLIAQGEITPLEVIEAANYNLKHATDDDPFFYHMDMGLPETLTILLFFSATALIGGWMIRPDYLKEKATPRNNIFFLSFFSLIGIGFMLIEIPLFQKFILFLGQPVYALTVLLFSLLIGAGIGSGVSGLVWKQRTIFKLRMAALMVGLIMGGYLLFLNKVFLLFLGAPFISRAIISVLLLIPLGFFLGIPFPQGMKLLKELGLGPYVPRMWCVNGIGSVLGSALAIAVAISFGFSYALIVGALIYFFIFILFTIKQRFTF